MTTANPQLDDLRADGGGDLVVLLGTGTCQLDPARRASSVLVETGGLRLVFDMGRGIAERLAALGLRQDDVRHLVLSHFHPDHVSDLVPWLQAAAWSRTDPRSVDLHVWGPFGLENQMMRILGLFGPDNLTRPSWQVRLHEARGETLEIEGTSFGWPSLPPADNHGLVFDAADTDGSTFRVALTGDSSFHEAEVEALRDCDIAIFDSGHLEDDEIVELLVRTDVPRAVATHVYRALDVDALQARAAARGYGGRLEVGEDLQVIVPTGGGSLVRPRLVG